MKEFSSSGCDAIYNERKRQIEEENYDENHDKNEPIENFIWASAAYATGCRRFWPAWFRSGRRTCFDPAPKYRRIPR